MKPVVKTNAGLCSTKMLLWLNAVLLVLLIAKYSSSSSLEGSLLVASSGSSSTGGGAVRGLTAETTPAVITTTTTSSSSSITSKAARSFLEIAKETHTDKVEGHLNLKNCLEKGTPCLKDKFEREVCRTWGHFYDTLYQRWLEPYSRDDTPPFQFLEIGFYSGNGFLAYEQFMPRADAHSIEISCLNDGIGWGLGNTAKSEHPAVYEKLIQEERLHCGSAVDYNFLDRTWNAMRAKQIPLRVVVDDASHLAVHMVTSVFYWFPKLEPGGLMVVEDIQPTLMSNVFRTQFLPQIMADVHWCGHPDYPEEVFFPTLQPLLHSVSCEMHICVFERNQEPARLDLTLEEVQVPAHALDYELARKLKRTEKSLK
jgi:hypothetical protein